jgi:hypothetical protein
MLGLALSLARPPVILGPTTDPVVLAWQAAGGSASESTLEAMDVFFKGLRADGVFSKVAQLGLMCGTNLASCLLPQIGVAPTNVGFVEGDYSQANGLSGNGVKYLDLNWGFTGTTGGFGFYTRDAWGTNAAARTPMGCKNSGTAAQIYRFNQTTAPAVQCFYGGIGGTTATAGLATAGFWFQNRASDSDLVVYKNGVSYGTRTNPTVADTPGVDAFLFGENNGSGTATGLVAVRMAAWVKSSSLTPTEVLALHNRLNTFQTALGRNA